MPRSPVRLSDSVDGVAFSFSAFICLLSRYESGLLISRPYKPAAALSFKKEQAHS
jgi:hypothetical protein